MELLKGASTRVGSGLARKHLDSTGKGLPGTNTLAYYEISQIRAVIIFITFGPARNNTGTMVNLIKLLWAVFTLYNAPQVPGQPANIRLGCKCGLALNALAYSGKDCFKTKKKVL